MVIYMIKRGNVTYNKKTGILDIANGEIIDMNKTETPSENTDSKKNSILKILIFSIISSIALYIFLKNSENAVDTGETIFSLFKSGK